MFCRKNFLFIVIPLLIGSLAAGGCGGSESDDSSDQNPSPSASVAGTYNKVNNECEDDGGPLTITQNGTSLIFNGGFDAGPSPYLGTISTDGTTTFTNGDGSCTGMIRQGVFSGSCTFPNEVCPFEYKQ